MIQLSYDIGSHRSGASVKFVVMVIGEDKYGLFGNLIVFNLYLMLKCSIKFDII